MKHKFIAIITIIFLAIAQQAVAQKAVTVSDSLGNVWSGQKNADGQWDGQVNIHYKNGALAILKYKNGIVDGKMQYKKDGIQLTGLVDNNLEFHDKAVRKGGLGDDYYFIFSFEHGKVVERVCIENRKVGNTIYAKFDNQFAVLDGPVEIHYENAINRQVIVKGTYKSRLPHGTFTAYENGVLLDKGEYANGKLISGTEVLGTNPEKLKLLTRKLSLNKTYAHMYETPKKNSTTKENISSENNSQNQGFDLGLNANKNNNDYDKDVEAAYNGVYAGLKQNGVKIIGTDLVKNGIAVVSGQMLYGNHNYAVVVISKSGATLKTVRENKLSSPTFSNIQNNNLGNGVTARYYQFKTFDNNIANKTLYAEVTQTSGTVAIIVYDNQK